MTGLIAILKRMFRIRYYRQETTDDLSKLLKVVRRRRWLR